MTGYWEQLTSLAEKWLPALLQMELQLTVVIMLALLADRWLKRAGSRFRYALWVVVLVKAIWPPAVSIPSLVMVAENPIHLPPITIMPANGALEGVGLSPWVFFLILWACASVALFGFILISGLSFRWRVSTWRSRPWLDPAAILPPGSNWPPIWQTDDLHSSLSIGFIRPRIHLNRQALQLGPAALLAVLYHELAHIRRRDGLISALQVIVLVMHPLNPLVWLLSSRLSRYREQICDDFALANGSVNARDYGHMLLNHIGNGIAPPVPLETQSYFFESKQDLKQRMLNLVDNSGRRSMVTTHRQKLLLAGLTTGVLLFSSQFQEEWSGATTGYALPRTLLSEVAAPNNNDIFMGYGYYPVTPAGSEADQVRSEYPPGYRHPNSGEQLQIESQLLAADRIGSLNVQEDAIGDIVLTASATMIQEEGIDIFADRPWVNAGDEATQSDIFAAGIIEVAVGPIGELLALEVGSREVDPGRGRSEGSSFYHKESSFGHTLASFTGSDGDGATSTFWGVGPQISITSRFPEFVFDGEEMLTRSYSPILGRASDAAVSITPQDVSPEHHGMVRVASEGLIFADLQGLEKRQWLPDPDLVLPPDYYLDADGDGLGDSLVASGGWLWFGDQQVDAGDLNTIHNTSVLNPARTEYDESTPIWTSKYNDYDRKRISYNFTGPLFSKAIYSFSGGYLDQNKARWDHSRRTNMDFLGKLTYLVSERTELDLSFFESNLVYDVFSYGSTNTGYLKYRGGYFPGYGPLYPSIQMIPQRFKNDRQITAQLTQALGPDSHLKVSVRRYSLDYEQKLNDYDDRDGDGNRDEYLVFREMLVKEGEPGTGSYSESLEWRYTDEDEDLEYIWTHNPALADSISFADTYDSDYVGEWKLGNRDNLAEGHIWTAADPTGWRHIWRTEYDPSTKEWIWIPEWRFVNGTNEFELTGVTHQGRNEGLLGVSDAYYHLWGDEFGYVRASSVATTIAADYTNQINPTHFLQAGVEYVSYNLKRFNIKTFSIAKFHLDEWDYSPTEWGGYIRDKIEVGGLIFTAGLRLDSYSLGSEIWYSEAALDADRAPIDPETFELVDPVRWANQKIYFSPRLTITHPVTDQDLLHFSYNHFLQRPDWTLFYENLNYNHAGEYEVIGNPNLEPQRTVTYQVGFNHIFPNDSKLDLTAYYKGLHGWLRQVSGGKMQATEYLIFQNGDFGSVTGFELSYERKFQKYIVASVNYAYQDAQGRLTGTQLGETYMWRLQAIRQEFYPLDYDQRHTLNVNVDIHIPASTNPLLLFGDWRMNLTDRFGSGLPFDNAYRAQPLAAPQENDERLPFTNELDLRVAKHITYGPGYIAVWLEVLNLLDRKNLGADPISAEWYLSQEDRDGNGAADHLQDPTGRRKDFTVWNQRRRVKVGLDISW